MGHSYNSPSQSHLLFFVGGQVKQDLRKKNAMAHLCVNTAARHLISAVKYYPYSDILLAGINLRHIF